MSKPLTLTPLFPLLVNPVSLTRLNPPNHLNVLYLQMHVAEPWAMRGDLAYLAHLAAAANTLMLTGISGVH